MGRQEAQVESTGKTIAYRLHNQGDYFKGLLLSNPTKRRATDQDGNEKSWSNGDPVFEWVYEFLNVDTNEHPPGCHFCSMRDGEDDFTGDTGYRKFYAKYKQHKAIQDAVRAAKNAQGKNELYGPVTLTYTGDDKDKKQPGKAAPRLYAATYSIPTDEEVARVDAFNGVGDEDNTNFDHYLDDEPDIVAPAGSKMSLSDMKNVK